MEPQYPGLDEDENGGMTHLGQIVKDAWVFGLLPETEQCAGWSRSRMQALYQQVTVEWDRYGNLPSRLPPELAERHARIYGEAMQRARAQGWDPELGEDD
jgi:hypothetical protein